MPNLIQSSRTQPTATTSTVYKPEFKPQILPRRSVHRRWHHLRWFLFLDLFWLCFLLLFPALLQASRVQTIYKPVQQYMWMGTSILLSKNVYTWMYEWVSQYWSACSIYILILWGANCLSGIIVPCYTSNILASHPVMTLMSSSKTCERFVVDTCGGILLRTWVIEFMYVWSRMYIYRLGLC